MKKMSHIVIIQRGLVGFKLSMRARMLSTTPKWSLPDRINPKASSLTSFDPFQPVALRMEESGPGSMPPISVQESNRMICHVRVTSTVLGPWFGSLVD